MHQQREIRIALTGGGSGGHIYPLLAVSEALEKLAVDRKLFVDMRYFGPLDSYKEILEAAGIKTNPIVGGKIRRYFSLMNIVDVPKFFIGLAQAFFKMFWFMPDVLFSKGGTAALPVVLAASFYRIPIIIHESDAQPGLNNLFSARFARRIAVSFERALDYFPAQKSVWTGSPVRRELLGGQPAQNQAKEELCFNPQEPLLLILGGSQGSQRINELIVLMLKDLLSEFQVLHQTGPANYPDVQKLFQAALDDLAEKSEIKKRYRAVPYLERDYRAALAAADLIVSRAGSNTIFEIATFSKPAILIPLPESANDHQRINAYEFSQTGAAAVIEELNLFPGIFLNQIRQIAKNPEARDKMSSASGKFFKPQAAEIIAEEIIKLANI